MTIKLQLAIDTLDECQALRLAHSTAPFIDIFEAGTPLIKSVGIKIVRQLKEAYPDKLVLADLKTSDVGAYEARMAFAAGADIVTTQGITTLATIAEVQREADKWGRRAEVDMTGVKDIVGRAREVKEIGVRLILVHRSIDEEVTMGASWDNNSCQFIQSLCDLGLDVAVAGGIDKGVLPLLQGLPLYAIVVGRGITTQADPAFAARKIASKIREFWV